MRELAGIGVGGGSAAGPVARMGEPLPAPPDVPSALPPGEELAAAGAACASVAAELRRRAALLGGEAGRVLDAQALIAEDPELARSVAANVAGGATAARAVYEAFAGYRDRLRSAGGYLAERVADLDDVRQRIVAACLGVAVPGVPEPGHPFVLVARDLAPADTALLDLSRVLALVTAEGGPTSHTAILARSRGIPAVVGCPGALFLADGDVVVVDAARSTVVLDPPAAPGAPAVFAAPGVPRPAPVVPLRPPVASAHQPGRTADGRPVPLLANVSSPGEAAEAVAAGAEGVGLLRTEFVFLTAVAAPGLAEQVAAYLPIMDAFAGRPVLVRVLDAGADKPLPFLEQSGEPNPALGARGLRALRQHVSVLDCQLAAIAAAAERSAAEVSVMAPMVTDPEDAAWFVARARAHGLLRAGAMVEIPAAALTAGSLLQTVSFASVGTNDLTQYTMAADRLVGSLGHLQDPWHPAVLRLVELVGAAGALTSKPVGVCGEAAADPLLASVLVGLGATSLSMVASAIAPVRAELARRSSAECLRFAQLAVSAATAAEARDRVRFAADS